MARLSIPPRWFWFVLGGCVITGTLVALVFGPTVSGKEWAAVAWILFLQTMASNLLIEASLKKGV